MKTAAAVVLVGLVGCASPRSVESVTPMIAISPGVPGRLALMDRYRLHDEDRKHMMERPRVWVEEVPEDDVPEDVARDEDTDDAVGDPDASPAPPPAACDTITSDASAPDRRPDDACIMHAPRPDR